MYKYIGHVCVFIIISIKSYRWIETQECIFYIRWTWTLNFIRYINIQQSNYFYLNVMKHLAVYKSFFTSYSLQFYNKNSNFLSESWVLFNCPQGIMELSYFAWFWLFNLVFCYSLWFYIVLFKKMRITFTFLHSEFSNVC